jgi:hypothetical protein
MSEYYKLNRDSEYFNVNGNEFMCKKLDIPDIPNTHIVLSIMAVKKGSGWSLDDSYVHDVVLTLATSADKVDELPAKINDIYTYKTSKHLKRSQVAGDYSEMLAIIHKFINESYTPDIWEQKGINKTSINFEKMFSYVGINSIRKTYPFFYCKYCKKVHKIDNLPKRTDYTICGDCAKKIKVCDRCGKKDVNMPQVHPKYKWLKFCSVNCRESYRVRMPRSEYNYSEDNDIAKSKTTANHISKRSFGLEVETADLEKMKPYKHLLKHWKVIGDGSLRCKEHDNNTGEWVSSVLRGDEGLKAINRLVDYFDATGIEANSSCGLHLHVGCEDFGAKELLTLVQFAKNNQTLIKGLESRERRANDYCSDINYSHPRSTTGFDKEDMYLYIMEGQKPTGPADKQSKAERFKSSKSAQSRYRWMNFCPFLYQGTMEIRLHKGTVDRKELVNWTKLWVGIFDGIKAGTIKTSKYRSFDKIIDDAVFVDDCKSRLKTFYTEYRRKNNG